MLIALVLHYLFHINTIIVLNMDLVVSLALCLHSQLVSPILLFYFHILFSYFTSLFSNSPLFLVSSSQTNTSYLPFQCCHVYQPHILSFQAVGSPSHSILSSSLSTFYTHLLPCFTLWLKLLLSL